MAVTQGTHRTVKLLLMGITGSGKSSTGNSILGRKQFDVGGSLRSVTDDVSSGYDVVDGCILHVIDGPGLEDTSVDTVEDKNRAILNVGQALTLCNGYVNAVLLVIKYGERFSTDQKNAVEAVQLIIGRDGMQKFGIVIITKQNDWIEAHSGTQLTLDQWCRNNDNTCGNIFSLCQFRCVLFENGGAGLPQRASQRTKLLKYVQQVKANGYYTNEHFRRAECERNKYIEEKKCSILKETYQREISLLYAEVLKISDSEDEAVNLKRYMDIFEKVKALMNKIDEEDRGDGALIELKDTLKQIVEVAREKNVETLQNLAQKMENLRTKKKVALTHAVLSSIAAVFTLGIATPLFIRKVKALSDINKTIDGN